MSSEEWKMAREKLLDVVLIVHCNYLAGCSGLMPTHCTQAPCWRKCLADPERWYIARTRPKRLVGLKPGCERKSGLGLRRWIFESQRSCGKNLEEFPPLFYNSCVPTETIPKHMKAYLKRTKRSGSKTKKLCGRLTGKKNAICLATEMVSRGWSQDNDGVKSLHGSWTR